MSQGSVQWWAVVNMVMNILEAQKVGYFMTSRVPACFARRILLSGVFSGNGEANYVSLNL
jgi:hypothetical protein